MSRPGESIVGAKAEIYQLLDGLAHQGLAIVVLSSEMPEILGLCDRVYVMREGRIAAEYSRAEATPEKLLASAPAHVGAFLVGALALGLGATTRVAPTIRGGVLPTLP